jgi:hypothetical protein
MLARMATIMRGSPDLVGQAQGIRQSRREGRRAKAATFREGDYGGTAPNPALIGRIASSLLAPVISLLSPCSLPVKCEYLPVIFPLCAPRHAPPYFNNRLKRKIILAAE